MTTRAIEKAKRAIARGDVRCHDLCAEYGQIFGNVKHMRWFVELIAGELYGGEVRP